MEQKSLHELLKEQLGIKSYTLERLGHLTGITDRHLEGLFNGDFGKLPAAPYVRGYLIKIAPLLDLNEQELWEAYKKEERLKRSGAEDKLPSNRFAIKTANRKLATGVFFGILAMIYFGWNISHLIGRPKLDIVDPLAQTVIVAEPLIKVSGYIDAKDQLFINREAVPVSGDGYFELAYSLQLGLNTVEFLAKRFLGRETKVIKQVIYQPQQ